MITLRPITPTDQAFLSQVYASTREAELAHVDWNADQKAAFLEMQFDAQHRYYTAHYTGAQFQIILLDGQQIGRLYVDRWASEIRIVDIALLPAYRRRGIGSKLLYDILAEGQRVNLPVTIHVECFNPAQRLYQRLGFRPIAETGVYRLMQWEPEQTAANEIRSKDHA